MTAPQPVKVVYTDPADYDGPEPKPLQIVGPAPGGSSLVEDPADPGTYLIGA